MKKPYGGSLVSNAESFPARHFHDHVLCPSHASAHCWPRSTFAVGFDEQTAQVITIDKSLTGTFGCVVSKRLECNHHRFFHTPASYSGRACFEDLQSVLT